MKILYIFSLFILLVSCGANKDKSNFEDLNNNPKENIERTDILNNLSVGNFSDVISNLESKGGFENLDEEEKDLLVYSYLQEGVYSYKEEEYSLKVIEALSNEEKNFQNLYFLGFANEIIKNYDEALRYYELALKIDSISDKEKSTILNQIGHTYDLKGETELAYSYYYSSYELDNTNHNASLNIGRYLNKKGEYELAIPYFEYGLYFADDVLKSEIYYTLSMMQYNIDIYNPNIEKSIEYAKKSIESFPKYPMGYASLAKGYYMLNDSNYNDKIEENLSKAIELNKNNSFAYELLGLYFFDKLDIDTSYTLLLEARNKIKNDPILMEDERVVNSNYITRLLTFMIIFNNFSFDEDNISNDINSLVDNGYKNILLKQLSRKNYGIFGEKGEEILNLITNL